MIVGSFRDKISCSYSKHFDICVPMNLVPIIVQIFDGPIVSFRCLDIILVVVLIMVICPNCMTLDGFFKVITCSNWDCSEWSGSAEFNGQRHVSVYLIKVFSGEPCQCVLEMSRRKA